MLLELQPKDTSGSAKGGDVRNANDITAGIIKYLLDELNMKNMVFNIDEIKNKMDAESKGPY